MENSSVKIFPGFQTSSMSSTWELLRKAASCLRFTPDLLTQHLWCKDSTVRWNGSSSFDCPSDQELHPSWVLSGSPEPLSKFLRDVRVCLSHLASIISSLLYFLCLLAVVPSPPCLSDSTTETQLATTDWLYLGGWADFTHLDGIFLTFTSSRKTQPSEMYPWAPRAEPEYQADGSWS